MCDGFKVCIEMTGAIWCGPQGVAAAQYVATAYVVLVARWIAAGQQTRIEEPSSAL